MGSGVIIPARPSTCVGWGNDPAFFYIWLALLLFMALTRLTVELNSAGRPHLIILDAAYELTTLLPIYPIVATAACLSRPIRGRPATAFILGFLTVSLLPSSWLGIRRPYAMLGLVPAVLFGLGAATLSTSQNPLDNRALWGYLLLFLMWWYCVSLLVD